MPRSKTKPRPINNYKEKRYMNTIFEESDISPPQSPRIDPKVPDAPVKKEKTIDLTQHVIFDVSAEIHSIETIRETLEMFPCMNDDAIDMFVYKRYYQGDTSMYGKLIIDTEFSLLDKETFIITQLLESFDITEDYVVTIPNSNKKVLRSYWS